MASEKILSSAQQLRVAMIAAAITGLIGVCVTSANYIYRCYGELRDLEAEVSTESRRVDLVLNRALEQVATSKETQERVEKRNAGIFDDINSLTTSKLSTTVCYQKQLEIAQDEAQYEIEVLSSNDLAAGLMAATRRLIESERSVWQIACNLDHTHQRERDNQLRTALITLKSSSETVAAANKRLQYELDLYAAEQHGHLRTMSNK